MAVRGVYSKLEEAMLKEWRERAQGLVGWVGEEPNNFRSYPVFHRVATKDLMIHMANAADYWNPLWRDESYGRNTRWGGMIACPCFQHCISHRAGLNYALKAPPELGIVDMAFAGDYWEFFKPIYVGDSFRVWVEPIVIEDITRGDENALRRFRFTARVKYINQHDEVTGIVYEHRVATVFSPGTKPPQFRFTGEYAYTSEEIEAIDRLAEVEEIRGSRPRYWEDVNIGDEPRPIVSGPITVWDQVVEMQGYGIAYLPMREVRRRTPRMIVVDPATNIPHKGIEFHLTEGSAKILGSYSTTINYPTVEHFLARLLTNWMGDDGFIRRLACLKFSNTPLGDTIFGRGRVTKKYVSTGGEHLVDLDVWMESVRGQVPDAASATVRLLSKEEVLKQSWKSDR